MGLTTPSGLTTATHGQLDHSAVTGVPAAGLTSSQHASADHSACPGVGPSGLLYGSGVPAPGLGVNGNFYFRSDGGVGTHIYFKALGTWAGLI